MKNKQQIPVITEETTRENARQWLQIIRYRESGTVIQLQDDCEYRVLEVINNPILLKTFLGPYYRKYLLAYLPIDQKDLAKSIKDTLIELCIQRKIGTKGTLSELTTNKLLEEIAEKGYEVGLFISHITSLLKNNEFQPFYELEFLKQTSKNLSLIVFSELDITQEKFTVLTDKASFLFDHVIKYPLYSEKDSRQFILYYCEEWEFSFPETTISEIVTVCGGYVWLIHHVVRMLRDFPERTLKDVFIDELLLKKLEAVWSKFTQTEKQLIRKASEKNLTAKDTLTYEYQYLKSIRGLIEKDGAIVLGIPLLSQVLEKENRLSTFEIRDQRICIGEKDITETLGKKEKAVMIVLISQKDHIVSRDVVAQAIWGEKWEDQFSDWAIDRLIHRLRLKLARLNIDSNLLKTVKKKGFVFG